MNGSLRTFFELLYEHSRTGDVLDPDVEIEIRSWRQSPDGKPTRALHGYKCASTITAAVRLADNDAGCRADVFHGVHPRRRGCGKAGEPNVAVLAALIVDIDCDKTGISREAAHAALYAMPWGGPTAINESGGGLHGYWVYRERIDATDENHEKHRKLSAYSRALINQRLGNDKAADEMSTRDRVLRSPETRNYKPERRDAEGRAPEVRLLEVHEDRQLDIDQALDLVPPDFNPDVYSRKARIRGPVDLASMPTEIPERIRQVLATAGISCKPMKPAGYIEAIKLFPCPACGQSDGGCYLTPKTGTLRTWHKSSCPSAQAPGGIPLHEWVPRYAPQAARVLQGPATPPVTQLESSSRLALVIGSFDHAIPSDALAGTSEQAAVGVSFTDAVWVDRAQVENAPKGGPRAMARSIAALAPAGTVLLPLRDAAGQVRQAVWLDGSMLPPAIALSRGDDAVAGSILVLGHVPAVVERTKAGEPLYVAHGVPDYLALLGMLAQRDDGQIPPVLGIVGHTKAVYDHMVSAWTLAGARPERVVVFQGPGYDEAATKRLDGTAGTLVVDLAGGSLDETLKTQGPAAVMKRLVPGRWTFKPPAHVLAAADRIMSDLKQAVMLAAHTSSGENPTIVVYVVPPGAGKSTLAQQLAGEIAAGRMVVPCRSKRPRSWPADRPWPPADRSVAFALPNHKLADEKFDAHEDLNVLSARSRFKGALADCNYEKNVADAYPYVGRRGICGDKGTDQRCELAEQGCPGAVQPEARRGEVAYITQALARHMKWDFCFVDEHTGVVDKTTIDADSIRTLFAGRLHPRVKRWRTDQNPDAADAARILCDLFDPIARQHGADVGHGSVDPYPRRITGEDLCRIIETNHKAWDLIDSGFALKAVSPPVPYPAELRGGMHAGKYMPNLQAFRVLQHLRTFYRRVRGLDKNDVVLPLIVLKTPDPILILQLNDNGTWLLEQREVKPLPKAPIVLLDATGEMTIDEYRAAYPQYRVNMQVMSVWGAQPRRSLHVQTKGVSSTALFTTSGQPKQRASASIRKLIIKTIDESRRAHPVSSLGGHPLTVGVLTYKAVWEMITKLGHPHAGRLTGLVAEQAARGVRLDVGYFGRDDKGTNRFENVHGLAVIGDARPNMGNVEADCLLLGLEPGKVLSARAQAVVIQAVFRARHTRRVDGDEPVILLASASAPDIAGLVWEPSTLDPGVETDAETLAYEMLTWTAAQAGVFGPKPLQLFDWGEFDVEDPVSKLNQRGTANALRTVIGERPTWLQYVISAGTTGRPITIWASDDRAAVRWAWQATNRAIARVVGHQQPNLFDEFGKNRAGSEFLKEIGYLKTDDFFP